MKRYLSLLCLVAAIVLMALPCGAVLVFATGPKETIVRCYSYFDFTVFGNGNFFPLITAVSAAAALLLELCYLFWAKGGVAVEVLLWLSFISSIVALTLTVEHITVVGAVAPIVLVLAAAFQMLFGEPLPRRGRAGDKNAKNVEKEMR